MSDALTLTVHRLVPVEVVLRPEDVLPHVAEADLVAEAVRRGLLPGDDALRLTGDRVRAARALVGWSRPQLAHAAGLSPWTVERLETGEGVARDGSVDAVRRALEAAGVRFVQIGDAVGVFRAPPAAAATAPCGDARDARGAVSGAGAAAQ